MDDVVAVRVTLENGEQRFFVTWGGSRIHVCNSLGDASDQPYFFEALLHFAHRPIPFGSTYDKWRTKTDARMRKGRDFNYLGRRQQPVG